MPNDPFEQLEDLFTEEPAPRQYVPTRQEPVVAPGHLRVPTRAEPIAVPRAAVRPEPAADSTLAYRPTHRPPLALLCVYDDGADDGEWVRIRRERFVIGRKASDLNITHDDQIADRHAEISRQLQGEQWVWHLTDLKSATGTFVAVNERPLRNALEIQLGSRRYRFEPSANGPALLIDANNERRRFSIAAPETTIGRGGGSGMIAITDDAYLSPQHARFELSVNGWKLVNLNSRNGIYVRTDRVRFTSGCRFLLGEQRFFVRATP